jgi:hypothetical protein
VTFKLGHYPVSVPVGSYVSTTPTQSVVRRANPSTNASTRSAPAVRLASTPCADVTWAGLCWELER